MEIIYKSPLFVRTAGREKYHGATVYFENEKPKILIGFKDYDPIIDAWILECENGEVFTVHSDDRMAIKFVDLSYQNIINKKPNRKRKKFRKQKQWRQ